MSSSDVNTAMANRDAANRSTQQNRPSSFFRRFASRAQNSDSTAEQQPSSRGSSLFPCFGHRQDSPSSPGSTVLRAAPYVGRSAGTVHTTVSFRHYLVPHIWSVFCAPYYFGVMDRHEAETVLEGQPEGSFLLRDSAQDSHLFSVSFRRYNRTLHARVEQYQHLFSFDCYDSNAFSSDTVTGLIEHYKDPAVCLFFEPQLSRPMVRQEPFSLKALSTAVVSSTLRDYDDAASLEVPATLIRDLQKFHYRQPVRVRLVQESELQ